MQLFSNNCFDVYDGIIVIDKTSGIIYRQARISDFRRNGDSVVSDDDIILVKTEGLHVVNSIINMNQAHIVYRVGVEGDIEYLNYRYSSFGVQMWTRIQMLELDMVQAGDTMPSEIFLKLMGSFTALIPRHGSQFDTRQDCQDRRYQG